MEKAIEKDNRARSAAGLKRAADRLGWNILAIVLYVFGWMMVYFSCQVGNDAFADLPLLMKMAGAFCIAGTIAIIVPET